MVHGKQSTRELLRAAQRQRNKEVAGAKSLVQVKERPQARRGARGPAETALTEPSCSRRRYRGDRGDSAREPPASEAGPTAPPRGSRGAMLPPAGGWGSRPGCDPQEVTGERGGTGKQAPLQDLGELRATGLLVRSQTTLVSMKITVIANIYYDPGTVVILYTH